MPGGEGGDQQLVKGALLALASHRQRGDDHHPDGSDHGDKRRHHEPFIVEIRVVPVAHHQLAVVRLRFTLQQLLLIVFHNLLQIVGGDLRAVGVASVEQKLQRGGLIVIQIAREIGREAHNQQSFLFIDGRLDRLRALQQQDVGKGFGAGKALSEFHRVATAVLVVDSDGGVGHLQRRGKGKQQHLNQHRHD